MPDVAGRRRTSSACRTARHADVPAARSDSPLAGRGRTPPQRAADRRERARAAAAAPSAGDTLTLAGRLEVRDRQRCDCCAEVRDLVALDLNFVLLARYPVAAAPDGRPEAQYRVPLARFCSPTQDLNRGYLQRSVEHANNCHQDELRRACRSTADTPMRGRRRHPHQPHARRRRAAVGRPDRRRTESVITFPRRARERRRARRPAARAAARRPLLRRPSRLPGVARGWQFAEVADRVWVARYAWFDVNVDLGRRRPRAARRRHARLRRGRAARSSTTYAGSGAGEVVARRQHPRALRPHLRQRHVPRGVRRDPGARPRDRGRRTVAGGRADQAAVRRRARRPARRRGAGDRDRAAPTTPSPRRWSLDLGDRAVELVHPGRGHTGGDLVVRVPDADVAAGRRPGRGVGARGTSRLRRRLLPAGVAAQPRHRARPDRRPARSSCPATARPSTATSSRSSATTSASSPRRSATWPAAASRSTRRCAAAEWPFPDASGLADAVRRGYEQLPRSQKRLPLV